MWLNNIPKPARIRQTNRNCTENWVERIIHFSCRANSRACYRRTNSEWMRFGVFSLMIFTFRMHFRFCFHFYFGQLCCDLLLRVLLERCECWSIVFMNDADSANKYWNAKHSRCACASLAATIQIHIRELLPRRARKLKMKLKKFTIAFSTWHYLPLRKLVVRTCVPVQLERCNDSTGWNYGRRKKNGEEKQENAQQKVMHGINRHHQQIEVHTVPCTHTMARCTEHHGVWTSFGKQINLHSVFVFRLQWWMEYEIITPELKTELNWTGWRRVRAPISVYRLICAVKSTFLVSTVRRPYRQSLHCNLCQLFRSSLFIFLIGWCFCSCFCTTSILLSALSRRSWRLQSLLQYDRRKNNSIRIRLKFSHPIIQ